MQDQDPLICKTVADSVRNRLQDFITVYRTDKARKDVRYYENLQPRQKVITRMHVVFMVVILMLIRISFLKVLGLRQKTLKMTCNSNIIIIVL